MAHEPKTTFQRPQPKLFEIGSLHQRSELHARFGGNPRAGICGTKSGVVLIFSDPKSGVPFGYDQHDFVEDGIYHYTGEGRVGDQRLTRGNKAILEGHTLLLFARVDRYSQVFVGEVGLADPPYYLATAQDSKGNQRSVIVFRFVPSRADFAFLEGIA